VAHRRVWAGGGSRAEALGQVLGDPALARAVVDAADRLVREARWSGRTARERLLALAL
jgi:hypothetical protein